MNSAPQLPQKKGSELSNNDLNGPTEERGHVHQWRPFGNPGFVDAYCKVKAHLLIRFRCGDGQEFIACFQRDWREEIFKDDIWESFSRMRDESFWEATCQRKFLSWSEGASRIYNAHGQEKTVLVNVVEGVELPKEDVPSLVWLDTVENFESILADGFYRSSQHGLVNFGSVTDWELRVPADDWDKPASEIIESAAQTIQNIAKNQWNLGRNIWNVADVISDVSRFRVRLTKGRDRIEVVKDPLSRVQFLDVLFGPIQLT